MSHESKSPPLGSIEHRELVRLSRTQSSMRQPDPIELRSTLGSRYIDVEVCAAAPVGHHESEHETKTIQGLFIDPRTQAASQRGTDSIRWYGQLHLALAAAILIALYLLASLFMLEAISLISAISLWPEPLRIVGYLLLAVPSIGVLLTGGGFILTIGRFRKAKKIRLAILRELEARGDLRSVAAKEAGIARQQIGKHLSSFDLGADGPSRSVLTEAQRVALRIARERLNDADQDLGASQWIGRFRTEFQSICDGAADKIIAEYRTRIAMRVSLSPFRLTDMLITLHGSLGMMRDLCRIYQLRMDTAGNGITLAWILGQTYMAGHLESGEVESMNAVSDGTKNTVDYVFGSLAGATSGAVGQYIGRQAGQALIQIIFIGRLGQNIKQRLRWVD